MINKIIIISTYFSNKFRALVPGGGTGSEFYLSEQLNHTQNSEIVYLDFSQTSMSYAQLKNQIRKTTNVVWIISWIESLPFLGLGNFDFVSCTGVLHHLKSPQNGLDIIKDVQVQYGGAGLMVYGKYGRTSVYQIQDLLRITNKNENSMIVEISNAKEVLKMLPKKHWFSALNLNELTTMGDIGVYDLLLHKRDVAYSISELYNWIERSNYHLIDFSQPESRSSMSVELRILQKVLYDTIKKLGIVQQHCITELISGNMIKQDVYVSQDKDSEARLEETDNVIFAYGSPMGFQNMISDMNNYHSLRNQTYVYSTIAVSYTVEGGDISSRFLQPNSGESCGTFAFPLTTFSEFVVTELTKRPTQEKATCELIKTFKRKTRSNLTIKKLKDEFQNIFLYLKQTGIFLLKHKAVGLFPKTCCHNQFRVSRIRS